MSTLDMIIKNEKLYQAFAKAIGDDYDLQVAIAYKVLNPEDYYLFCKDDAWDKVDWEQVWTNILEQFYVLNGKSYDIRDLCSRAYDIHF